MFGDVTFLACLEMTYMFGLICHQSLVTCAERMLSKGDSIESKLAKRYRRTAQRLPGSAILLLILAAAILNFLPMRVTLAAGNTFVDRLLGPGASETLLTLSGTHITLDSPSNFMNTTILNRLLKASFNSSILSALTSRVDFLALKAETITLDVATKAQSTNGSATLIQLRIILSSLTISGYHLAQQSRDRYNETSLTGLNPSLIVTLDRAFFDLFIDPSTNVALYEVSADMTVYQGIALLLEGTV